MIEKQFTYNRCEDGFYDIIDMKNHHAYPIGNFEIFIIGIVGLLNNLAEKNKKSKQFKRQVLQLIDEKIKDVEKELEDYHLENENAMLVGRLWALKELKEELMENEEWLEIESEGVIL